MRLYNHDLVRDPSFDVLKAFLMYFVIRGHLVSTGIVNPPIEPPPSWIGAMIVGASMPCFFAISGLFAMRKFEQKNWTKVASHIIGLLWPIFAFGFVFGLLQSLNGRNIMLVLTTPLELFRNLWFLRTLAFINIIAIFVFAVTGNKWGRLGMFGAVYIVLIFFPQRFPLYLYSKEVMNMLPYFVFGMFFKDYCMESKFYGTGIAASLFFVIVALVEGRITENGMGFYWVSHHWRDLLLTKHGVICFVGRTVMGIAGTIFLLKTFRFLLSLPRFRYLSYLAPMGTTTLGVYTIHQWILARAGHAFSPFLPLSNEWKWIIAGMVFFVCHVIIVIIQRNHFVNSFFFGDEPMVRVAFSKLFSKVSSNNRAKV